MKRIVRLIALLLPILPLTVAGQTKQDSIWRPVEFFVGTWSGTGEGEPGKGDYERTYQFVLNKKFIEVRIKSACLASKTHPDG